MENLDLIIASKTIYNGHWIYYGDKTHLKSELTEWLDENAVEVQFICASGSGITVMRFAKPEDKLHFTLVAPGLLGF